LECALEVGKSGEDLTGMTWEEVPSELVDVGEGPLDLTWRRLQELRLIQIEDPER
jgi:hypothetical protein